MEKVTPVTIVFIFLGGLIIGALARLAMPTKDCGGIALTSLLGGASAIVAGFLGQFLGWFSPAQPPGFLICMMASVAALTVYRVVAFRFNS